MMKYITDLWLGKITLGKTYWYLILFQILYSYLTIYYILEGSEAFYIFADILGVVISFFILACVWRSAINFKGKKIWPFLSKITVVLNVGWQLYFAFFRFIFN